MTFHLSAIPHGDDIAEQDSLRASNTYLGAFDALIALVADYPPTTHRVRVITTRGVPGDDRTALRMMAHALGLTLDLV